MSCLKIKNNLAFLMNKMKYTVKISRLISQRNKSLSRKKNLRKKYSDHKHKRKNASSLKKIKKDLKIKLKL